MKKNKIILIVMLLLVCVGSATTLTVFLTQHRNNDQNETSKQAKNAVDEFSKSTDTTQLDVTITQGVDNSIFQKTIQQAFDLWLTNKLANYNLLSIGTIITSASIVTPSASGSLKINDSIFAIKGKDGKTYNVSNVSFNVNVHLIPHNADAEATEAITVLNQTTATTPWVYTGPIKDSASFDNYLIAQLISWWSNEGVKLKYDLLTPNIVSTDITAITGYPATSNPKTSISVTINFNTSASTKISKTATLLCNITLISTAQTEAVDAMELLVRTTTSSPYRISTATTPAFVLAIQNEIIKWWTNAKTNYQKLSQTDLSTGDINIKSPMPGASGPVGILITISFTPATPGSKIDTNGQIVINYTKP